MSRAFLFSGQGSQYVGMGADLVAAYPEAAEIFSKADAILGYSITDLCQQGPVEKLKETRYTQPALFVHEAAILAVLASRLEINAVAGHSLGEISALYCASVLSFEDALRLVARRAELMFQAGLEHAGTMAAIIGLNDDIVEKLCGEINDGVVVAANYNAPGQVVISGDAQAVRDSLSRFKEAGARMVTELQVSGAFHSPLLASAQKSLAEAINATTFNEAKLDVYCNVDAKSYRDPASLQNNLIQQLVNPVRWTQSLMAMSAAGITEFVEIGPGKVLQGLVKRCVQGASISGFDTVADIQKL